jgi:threonylcarbamoyladenosine tRNA methylthiotransferase MtaB
MQGQEYHLEDFGCRATQADAAALERELRARGMASGPAERASLIVVHTCTVTADADRAARKAIRALHRANPGARIIVTGCYAQRAPEELAAIEGVAHVVGNAYQAQIPALASRLHLPVVAGAGLDSTPTGLFPAESLAATSASRETTASILWSDLHGRRAAWPAPEESAGLAAEADAQAEYHAQFGGDRTRPILKIQDGCNNRCAFCVIPRVRGASRSMAPARVIAEVSRLCAAGAREMVLSGINLGSYGRDLAPRASLLDVLRRILDETPLERLRLSSVEPQDVTQDLVDSVAANSSPEGGRMARHFHVPLQSGSDRILAAMRRWYRAEHYARRIELIRERIPGAAIGADVIVGFPGETEEDFAATRALVERLPFTYLHVFAFSSRPGTSAHDAIRRGARPVAHGVIKRRSGELRGIAAEKAGAFRRAQSGTTLRVLSLDGGEEGWTPAVSDNHLSLRLAGRLPRNLFVRVRLSDEGAQLLVAQ